ncbi:MAG: hypothetical protein ACK4SL_00470 [Candidatus Paceibacteria bacterium]
MKTWPAFFVLILVGIGFLAVSVPVYAAVSCDSFTVTPTSALPGDFVTLDWTTTGATDVTIDAIGAVATTGSTIFEVPNSPGTFTFSMEVSGGSIFEPETAFCSTDLTINSLPVCDVFTATPDTLTEPGEVTLTWDTASATTSVTIDNGIGVVAEDDSVVVSVAGDTTYTLTAVNAFGSTQCTASVTFAATDVGSLSSGGGGKSINPRCDLTIDTASVMAGDTALISYEAVNATNLMLIESTAGGSKTLFSTTTSLGEQTGTWPVTVLADTTYTLKVTRPHRSSECTAVVALADLSGLGLGEMQGASSLALRNLPDTGFYPTTGFIVIMNVVLVAAAAFVAYVIVVFGQLARRAKTVPIRDRLFTPQTVLYLTERTTLQTKLLLWRIIAVTIILLLIIWYAFR